MKPVAMKPVPKSSPSTIRDVAQAAGVSPGTVSRVLNNSPLVTETTRKKVLEVVEALDYRPNLIARRLSIGKTLRIGAIVYQFARPAEIERLKGVVSSLSGSQYDLVIHNVETLEERELYFHQVPHKERVDGVIVISLPPGEENIERLASSDVPTVFIDVQHEGLEMFDRVVSDDFGGGQMATRYLISLSHSYIGFVGDKRESGFNFTSSHDRLLGFKKAIQSAGLPLIAENIAHDRHDRYAAHLVSEKMLSRSDRPSAIFAASDTQAMGVLTAARSLGLSIPQDLAVIGYDDIEIAEYLGLTTVRQMLFESGQIGVGLLLDRMINPQSEIQYHQIQNELVIRSTTRASTGQGL